MNPTSVGPPCGRSVQFVALGALTVKNRNPIGAAQQSLANTASALVANIQHDISPSK